MFAAFLNLGRFGARRSALGALARSLVPCFRGLLLLSAAGLKGYELVVAPQLETSLETLRASRIAVIEIELILGVWLLSGLWPWAARGAALTVFLVFFAVSLTKALAGETNCGCFYVPIDPRWTAALDLAAILALWRWHPPKIEGRLKAFRRIRLAVLLALVLGVGIPSGIGLAVSGPTSLEGDAGIDGKHSAVLLEPEKWVGRRCPLLPFTDLGEELSHGRWLVVLYHHDCPRCRDVVPVFEAMASNTHTDPTAPRIAFIAVPPHGAPLWQFAPHMPCRQGRLREDKTWLVNTPTVLSLQDGVVQLETNS